MRHLEIGDEQLTRLEREMEETPEAFKQRLNAAAQALKRQRAVRRTEHPKPGEGSNCGPESLSLPDRKQRQ